MSRYGPTPRPLSERLWSRVAASSPDACWPWLGGRSRQGYGRIGTKRNGKRTMIGTHVAAWEATHGPVPPGLWVLHHCDNPICCNPGHLFLGTAADNTQDSWRKGRHAFQKKKDQ